MKDTIEIKREDLKDILEIINHVQEEDISFQNECAFCHTKDCKLYKSLKLINKLLREK